MELFIRIENGSPVDHPITLENLLMVYPDFDPNNPPSNFAPFVMNGVPGIGHFEVYEGVSYRWEANYVTDIHHVRPMTDEEKQNYINKLRQKFLDQGGDEDWIFNENTITFVPPIPYPQDGQRYIWERDSNTWIVDTSPIPIIPLFDETANTVLEEISNLNIEVPEERMQKLYQLIHDVCEQKPVDSVGDLKIDQELISNLNEVKTYIEELKRTQQSSLEN